MKYKGVLVNRTKHNNVSPADCGRHFVFASIVVVGVKVIIHESFGIVRENGGLSQNSCYV